MSNKVYIQSSYRSEPPHAAEVEEHLIDRFVSEVRDQIMKKGEPFCVTGTGRAIVFGHEYEEGGKKAYRIIVVRDGFEEIEIEEA